MNKDRGYLSYEEVVSRPSQPISAPPRLDLTTLTLADLENVTMGYQEITFDEFCAVLKETIGADRDYAGQVWQVFDRNPIGYCGSRFPLSQGEALTALALQKAQAKR